MIGHPAIIVPVVGLDCFGIIIVAGVRVNARMVETAIAGSIGAMAGLDYAGIIVAIVRLDRATTIDVAIVRLNRTAAIIKAVVGLDGVGIILVTVVRRIAGRAGWRIGRGTGGWFSGRPRGCIAGGR